MSRHRLPRLDWLRSSQSLHVQFGALSAIMVAVSVLVIGLIANFYAQFALRNQVDRELVSVAAYAAGPIGSDVAGMGGLNTSALSAANVTLLLLRTDGQITRVPDARPVIDPGPEELMIARIQRGASTRTVISPANGQPYRVVSIPLSTENGNFALVLARPLSPTLTTLSSLAFVMGTLSFGVIVVSAIVGYASGRAMLRPVRDLTNAVARVTETDQFIPIGNHSKNELGELSRSFDTMLNSLESSRNRQRRLIADAGHELRTPLTSMRTNIELLVADDSSGMLPEGARGEILADVAAQLGEFSSLVGDLVQLSRDDVVTPSPEPLDFAEVVKRAIVRAERRGPGLTWDVNLDSFFIIGEPDTLERAITNLLDNAVKFSPEGATVHVKLKNQTLTIGDEGPGIAEDDIDKIFDRFYRSNKARNTPGTGLGLSIVDHTITGHGGWVKAGNRAEGGAEFTLWLPEASLDEMEDDD